ncbi:MAG: glycosyltransferase [Myxococcota bacterium]
MRIALATEGTRGDVYPLLALGDSLAAAGHRVVVCAPPDFRASAAERGLEFRAVGRSIREFLAERADVLLGGAWRLVRQSSRYLDESLEAQFRDLPRATEGAELIVAAGAQLAAASIAELSRTPYRYVAYCPVLLPSAEHPPVFVPRQTLPRWVNRLAWRGTIALYDNVLGRRINAQRAHLGLAPVGDVHAHLLTRRPLLAADAALAPRPADCDFAVEQVRGLHPQGGEALPAKLEAFLDAGPPPVYLGFGSMPDPHPAATTRAVLDAVGAVGCRAVISRGWAGLGDGPLPGNVFVTGPVSHPRLFPRVAAAVHHGGAGTTTAVARAGVPQIVVPHIADQFYWGRRVSLLGLGPPPLPRAKLTAPRLAAALAAILDNELLAERAREFGARLLAALEDAPDPARRLVDALPGRGSPALG